MVVELKKKKQKRRKTMSFSFTYVELKNVVIHSQQHDFFTKSQFSSFSIFILDIFIGGARGTVVRKFLLFGSVKLLMYHKLSKCEYNA